MDSLVTRYPGGPRVLVCGGADYADRTQVLFELDELKPSVVIHEAAPVGTVGAAALAAVWCRVERVSEHIRHTEFADQHAGYDGRCAADLILAFPGADKTAVTEFAERFAAPIKEWPPIPASFTANATRTTCTVRALGPSAIRSATRSARGRSIWSPRVMRRSRGTSSGFSRTPA